MWEYILIATFIVLAIALIVLAFNSNGNNDFKNLG